MERQSRSLRTLPVRLSEESSRARARGSGSPPKTSPSRASPKKTKEKSPARKNKEMSPARKNKEKSPSRLAKEKSPARRTRKSPAKTKSPTRSRSRSIGRKKNLVNLAEKKPSPNEKTSVLTNAFEALRKSLSPEPNDVGDTDSLVRRSLSRLDELTSDIKRSLTPRTQNVQVTTRSSLRLRTTNNVPKEIELINEKVVKNHVGVSKKEETSNTWSSALRILYSTSLFFLLVVLSSLVIAAHVLCNRNDCRLVVPTCMGKFLDFQQYYDHYHWLALTGGALLVFASSRFIQTKIKRAPYLSPLGLGWCALLVASLAVCHFYFGGLRSLKLLPLVTGSLLHIFILAVLSDTFPALHGVKLNLFIFRLSAVLTLIIDAWIAGSESYRTVPNPGVYLLSGLQAWTAVDSLVFEPLLPQASPLYLLILSVRPLILSILPTYVSANNLKVHPGLLVAVGFLHLIGYFLYRYSNHLKGSHTYDPKQRNIRSHVYGEVGVGPWKVVRHPDLDGRLILEVGWALATLPSPLSYAFPILSLVSTILEAIYVDSLARQASPAVKHSLLPLLY